MFPSKSGRNLETGEPGDGASSPHYAMHNIHTQSTHLSCPCPCEFSRPGGTDRNVPSRDTAWQASKEQFEEPKKKKKKKKQKFSEAPTLPHQPPARGPRTLSNGPAKTRSQGPIPLSGRPLANPPQIRGHHVAYQYCIVCTIL